MTLDLAALRKTAEAAKHTGYSVVQFMPDDALALLARAEEANTLLAEHDRLREQVARMTDALGEEWPMLAGTDRESLRHCPECRHWKHGVDNDFEEENYGANEHAEDCTRGRFFAASKEAQT